MAPPELGWGERADIRGFGPPAFCSLKVSRVAEGAWRGVLGFSGFLVGLPMFCGGWLPPPGVPCGFAEVQFPIDSSVVSCQMKCLKVETKISFYFI